MPAGAKVSVESDVTVVHCVMRGVEAEEEAEAAEGAEPEVIGKAKEEGEEGGREVTAFRLLACVGEKRVEGSTGRCVGFLTPHHEPATCGHGRGTVGRRTATECSMKLIAGWAIRGGSTNKRGTMWDSRCWTGWPRGLPPAAAKRSSTARWPRSTIAGQRALLLWPQTLMNRSGRSVAGGGGFLQAGVGRLVGGLRRF